MTLIIELPRPVEARLEAEASKAGVSPDEYAAELLARNLPALIDSEEQRLANAPSIALLHSWLQRAEAEASPEQKAQADAELAEFMLNMNASRKEAGERLLYPDAEK